MWIRNAGKGQVLGQRIDLLERPVEQFQFVAQRGAMMLRQRLQQIDDITGFVRRTGRAELDEHAEPVSASEYIIDLDPASPHTREEQLDEIREAMADIPGITTATEQPLAHLISHMLSGVKAQIGIKLYGDDLELLRNQAHDLKEAIQGVPGVTDLFVEQQVQFAKTRALDVPVLILGFQIKGEAVGEQRVERVGDLGLIMFGHGTLLSRPIYAGGPGMSRLAFHIV